MSNSPNFMIEFKHTSRILRIHIIASIIGFLLIHHKYHLKILFVNEVIFDKTCYWNYDKYLFLLINNHKKIFEILYKFINLTCPIKVVKTSNLSNFMVKLDWRKRITLRTLGAIFIAPAIEFFNFLFVIDKIQKSCCKWYNF